jgi:hypothetical protein
MSTKKYHDSFEDERRIKPRLGDADYCILKGLSDAISDFSLKFVGDGKTIIDFGCGAKPYRTLFPKSSNYIGVDVGDNPYADILIERDGFIPFKDSEADVVISTQALYLVPDYLTYLRECHRLLSKKGYLFLTSHGTWTHHPASGGDYYRFTSDGLRYILDKTGFVIDEIIPIIGTLGTGLHLRQLIFNHWLKKIGFNWVAKILNIIINVRIILEDKIQTYGTKMSSPVAFAVVARPKINVDK